MVSSRGWGGALRRMARHRRSHQLLGAVSVVAAAFAGLVLVPPVVSGVGPTAVSLQTSIGSPKTVVRLPALGTVSATTHRIPFRVRVDIEQVDVEQLADLATSSEGRAELNDMVADDLVVLARKGAIRLVLGVGVLGLLVSLILFHRRWRTAFLGAVGSAGAASLLMMGMAMDYEIAAFDDPTFNGPITKAHAVIEAVGDRVELLDEARSRYEVAAQRMSELMVILGDPAADPRDLDTVILHVSDIHGNPFAFDFISELASEFDVDGVIDTGDISSSFLDTGELSTFGGPIDDLLIRAIQRLDVPYLFVSGNHDSPSTLRRLSSANNLVLLDGSSASIGPVDVFGWGDPTYSIEAVPEVDKSEERASDAPEVAQAFAESSAEILAVHDGVLGQEVVGDAEVILAGHTHEQGVEEAEGTIVLTVGSTGATGLKSLTLEADKTYDAELLYFEAGQLVTVDYVQLRNLQGDFVLERRRF